MQQKFENYKIQNIVLPKTIRPFQDDKLFSKKRTNFTKTIPFI